METVKKTAEKLVLRMPVNYSLANAIRRSMDEISVLAIDEVEIFKNDSALYDEFLAHRMGLVPLKTDSKMTSKTNVTLKLVKSGPDIVYTKDLKGSAKTIYDNIPLTILEKGQEIQISATAKLGTGLEHAKYSPGLCYYRNILEVSSNPQIDKIVQGSKKSGMKAEKKGSKWLCDLPEANVDEILKIDKDAIKDSDEMLFFVESWGQLDAETIVKKSIDTLNNNLREFEKNIK